MALLVKYRVDVYATVEDGQVTSVNVHDENIVGPIRVLEDGGDAVVPWNSKRAQDAVKVAESEVWPAWEFGW